MVVLFGPLTHISLETFLRDIDKECTPRSESPLFDYRMFYHNLNKKTKKKIQPNNPKLGKALDQIIKIGKWLIFASDVMAKLSRSRHPC